MSYVVAIDFECAGGVPSKYGFTQLGAVIMKVSEECKVISSFNSYSSMEMFQWDDRCVEEFWDKHPVRFAETKLEVYNPMTPQPWEVLRNFMAWVRKETAEFKDSVYLISDNVAFDVGVLRHFSSETDVLYMFGSYREVVDVSSAYMGMSFKPVDVNLMNKSSKELALEAINERLVRKLNAPKFPPSESHHPVDDAKEIASYWCWFQFQLMHLPQAIKEDEELVKRDRLLDKRVKVFGVDTDKFSL
jgi:hypothetical protein